MRGWTLLFFCVAAVLFAGCLFPPIHTGACEVVKAAGSVQDVGAVQVVENTAKSPSVYWWIALVGAVINTVIGFITANPPKDGKGGK